MNFRRLVRLVLFALIASACAHSPAGVLREPANPDWLVLYHSGRVLTMMEDESVVEAFAVRGEKIVAVGSNEEILALEEDGAQVIDLGYRTVMPGFVDAHTHLLNDAQSQAMSLDEAQTLALKNGITTIGDLYVDKEFLRKIQAFDAAGFLRVRTSLYLVATDPCGKRLGDWWHAYPPTREPGEMLRINGIKIFSDGGSCGKVALSFEIEPGWGLGDLWFTEDELTEMIAAGDAAGYQVAVHAIGDRAVDETLNAFETVLDGGPNTLRHRMEHVSVIAPPDVPRFGTRGIIPVLLGEYPNCTPYGPPIPAEYGPLDWPWRALRIANPNLPLAWHTDVPFQSINPFDHLLGFTTRIDLFGRAVCPPAEWLLENTLLTADALKIMTMGSAYALSRDTEVGSLEAGKYADFIVVANDPLSQMPEDLADNRVLLTVVGGRVEYCWPVAGDLCPGFSNRRPAPLPDTRPPVIVIWLVAALLVGIPLLAMLRRDRMPVSLRRLFGWAAVVGGAAWLTMVFLPGWEEGNLFVILFIFPPFLLALGVAGLAAAWREGRLGGFGLWLSLLGAISLAEGSLVSEWFHNDMGWAFLMLGILGHSVGLILFGLANRKGGILGRWKALPLVIGLFGGPVPFVLGSIFAESTDLPWYMLFGVLGGGWLLLGWLSLTRRKE